MCKHFLNLSEKPSQYSDSHGKLLTLNVLKLIEKIILQIPAMKIPFFNEGIHHSLVYQSNNEVNCKEIDNCLLSVV